MRVKYGMSRAGFLASIGLAGLTLAGCSSANGRKSARGATVGDAACVDDNANVTVYAVINLSGKELDKLLVHQNYEWSAEEYRYVATDGAALFACSMGGGDSIDASNVIPFEKSDYRSLEPGGDGKVVVYKLSVTGYSNGKTALAGAVGDASSIEKKLSGSDIHYALIRSLEEKSYLAGVYNEPDADGVIGIYVYNEAAVEAGLLTDGEKASIEDVWDMISKKLG